MIYTMTCKGRHNLIFLLTFPTKVLLFMVFFVGLMIDVICTLLSYVRTMIGTFVEARASCNRDIELSSPMLAHDAVNHCTWEGRGEGGNGGARKLDGR